MSRTESKLLQLAICLIIVHMVGIAVGVHDTRAESIGFTIGTFIACVFLFFSTNFLEDWKDKKDVD